MHPEDQKNRNKGWDGLGLPVFALGATSIVTQIVLLREFLSTFYGNEMIIGVILANWMILTGIGSYVGRYSAGRNGNARPAIGLLIALALLPLATVFLLRFLRNIVWPVGTAIGLTEVLYGSFVLMAPYCVTAGFGFALLARTISESRGSNLVARVYAMEAAGSLAGGLAFNVILIFFLTTFQSLFLIATANSLAAFIIASRHTKRLTMYASFAISICAALLLAFAHFDILTREFQFKDQKITYLRDTPYGNLTVTRQAEQRNFFENGILLFSTDDVILKEEGVHYAMIQHPNAKRVLLISGGICGMLDELLKYKVDKIDYVEINPWLIEAGRDVNPSLQNERVRLIHEDARLFVKRTTGQYDVVLVNVSDPSTAQLNRFYTVEFFEELKKHLTQGAVVSLSLESSADYMGADARTVRSIIYSTLKTSFENILIVPGNRDYFLASDKKLDIRIGDLVDRAGISTSYVNKYYVDDESLQQRSGQVVNALDRGAALNRDFSPVAYYQEALYWSSQFDVGFWVPLALLALIACLAIGRMNAVSFGIFAGGFAACSLEVVLMVSFQILYGYVYQVLGIIVTLFMAGLAVGALYKGRGERKSQVSSYAFVQFSIAAYSILLPIMLDIMKTADISRFVVQSVLFAMTFAIAVFIGAEFAVATRLQRSSTGIVASELYGMDLVGSSIGALLVSAYLMPLLGISNACFIVAGLLALSGTIILLNKKRLAAE